MIRGERECMMAETIERRVDQHCIHEEVTPSADDIGGVRRAMRCLVG